MSKSVDNRVVQMQFNNKQFEANAKQSMNTLEKLKQALNFSKSSKAFDGLDKAAKTNSLDRIADSVEALEKRFSFLGETARKVVNNIASTLTGTLGRAISFVQEGIVSGGVRRAMNLENAHFQLQALLKDEAKVQEVMANANTAVDGTAYSFDEAAKAASMFAASGLQAGDEMVNALRGIVGTAAMTNSQFEDISMIFTSVAGQGRLMGDQLLQLSSRGLNAAATIAEFFNGVNDGSKQASAEVTAAIQTLSKGAKMAEGDIRDLTSQGEISFKIFAEAMTEAFADSAEKANETFTGAISNIKAALARIGAGFISPLVEQNSKIVRLFNVVREKINEVKGALVFDESVGNVEAYSKRFTHSVLVMAREVTKFVKHLDIKRGMKVFYNVVDSIINVVKGLGSVLAPVGKAFSNVFLGFNVKDVIRVTKGLKEMTAGFKLSEDASKNLQDTFEGLFSIVKLVGDVFVNVLQAILPINGPVISLSGGILGLTGALGRGITALVEWIEESEAIEAVCTVLATGLSIVSLLVVHFIETLKGIGKAAQEFGLLEKAVGLLLLAFQAIGKFAAPYVDILIDKIEKFASVAKDMIPKALYAGFQVLVEWVEKAKKAFDGFTLDSLSHGFHDFKKRVDDLLSSMSGSKGIQSFISTMKDFGTRLKEVFDFKRIVENIESFRKLVTDFVNWFNDTIGSVFENASVGSVFAGAGGIAIFSSIIKIAKMLEESSKNLSTIPKLLGSLSSSLEAYQKKIKAEALKESAKAMLILAGALVVLSLVDTDRVMEASVALSLIAGVLLVGVTKLMNVVNKGHDLNDAVLLFSKGLSKSMNNLTKAVKYKALGSAFKDFGASIMMIAGSLIALGLMYEHNPEALEEAGKLVAIIAAVMVGIMAGMTIINKKMKGANDLVKSALSVTALSIALTATVKALSKLFKMELPNDYQKKIAILIGILGGLAAMTLVMAKASKDSKGTKISSGPIMAMALLLMAIVSSVKKIFKMELPSDYQRKLLILAGVFVALDSLILALGKAASNAGGAIKAGGTILALAVMVATITGSLMILSVIPAEGMLKGAVALGGVLLAVSQAISAASKVAGEDTYKTVLAMAATVGAITISLAVLSTIPLEQLAVSAVTLGTMLLALATNFNAVSKITNESAWQPIVAMIGVLVTIAGSLYILSQQPWDQMLAAGTAMSATLIAFAIAFKSIGEHGNIDIASVEKFLAVTLAVVPIGIALYQLSQQPWEGMLASGAALSATVLAFTAAFAVISKCDPDVGGIGKFLLATTALIPVGAALYILSSQPWENMLAAGASISAVVLAMSAAMAICAGVGTVASGALTGIGLLDLFIANFSLVLVGLGKIFEDPAAKKLMSGGGDVLQLIGEGIGKFVGGIVGGALAGITDSLPKIGANLTAFMESARGFFQQAGEIDESAMRGVKYMAEAILILTAGDLISGLTSWLTGGSSFETFGEELEKFGPHLAAYSQSVAGLDTGVVEKSAAAAKVLADMAESLPNSGGLASKIFGDNSLADFGSELEKFGPHLAAYAQSVASVDGGVVQKSADAAQVLADMASKLPNSGGLAAKIFGDNNLSDFGKELEKFGPYLSAYANSIKDIDPSVVTASAAAAQVLSELANGLPNSGGLVSLFTGDNGIAAFGESLVGFGEGLKGYYEQVSGIDPGKLQTITDEIKKLAEMLTSLKGINAQTATGFKQALQTLGEVGVQSFASSFTNGTKKVTTAVEGMLNAVSQKLQNKVKVFQTYGEKAASTYATGLTTKKADLTKAVSGLITAFSQAIQGKNATIKQKGAESAGAWIAGIKGKQTEVANVTRTFVEKAIKVMAGKNSAFSKTGTDNAKAYISGLEKAFASGFNPLITKMVNNGKRLVEGIAKGINTNLSIAQRAASQLATKIDEQVKKDLDIHSPSKVGELRGDQYDQGIAIGLTKNMSKPINAAKEIANGIDGQLAKGAEKISARVTNILSTVAGVAKGLHKQSAGTHLKGSDTTAYDQYLVTQQHVLNKEEDYWEKLLRIKQQGAEAEKYIDMDIVEFRKAIQDESNAIVEEYNSQVKSLQDSVNTQLSLFSEVDQSLTRTRKEQEAYEKAEEKKKKKQNEETEKQTKLLDENLSDQLKIYDQFYNTMKSLTKKLKGTNLLEAIKDQGIDALPQLLELNKMTDKQLSEYSAMYDKKLMYAYDIASLRLTDLKEETQKQLEEIYSVEEKGTKKNAKAKEDAIEVEKNYWERLLEVKRSGAEAEKYMETSIEDFRASILEQTNELLKSYEDQLKSTRDSIMSQMDLFTEVEEKEALSEEALFNILQGQIEAYEEYARTMESLSKKLAGSNLLDEILEMGVTSLDQLKVYDQMSDERLKEYSDAYDKKLEIAGKAAETKIAEIKAETEKNLKDLFGTEGQVDLDEFTKQFDGTFETIEQYVAKIQQPIDEMKEKMTEFALTVTKEMTNASKESMEAMRGVAKDVAGAFMEGMDESGKQFAETASNALLAPIKERNGEFQAAGEEVAASTVAGIKKKDGDFELAGSAEGSKYTTGIKNKYQESNSTGTGLSTQALNGVNLNKEAFVTAGKNAGQGYVDGILSMVAAAQEAARQLASTTVDTSKSELDEHSPSKKMGEVGKNAALGYINMFMQYISIAANASRQFADASIDEVNDAFNDLSPFYEDNVFDDPVLRPQVDLTAVRQSAEDIRQLFNNAIANTALGANDISTAIKANANSKNSPGGDSQNNSEPTVINYDFTQNNYSPKALSETDIYRQTKNQFSLFRTVVAKG